MEPFESFTGVIYNVNFFKHYYKQQIALEFCANCEVFLSGPVREANIPFETTPVLCVTERKGIF